MVENVWIEDDDVVVSKHTLDSFEKMQKYIQYVEKHFPSVHTEVVNNIVSLKEIAEKPKIPRCPKCQRKLYFRKSVNKVVCVYESCDLYYKDLV